MKLSDLGVMTRNAGKMDLQIESRARTWSFCKFRERLRDASLCLTGYLHYLQPDGVPRAAFLSQNVLRNFLWFPINTGTNWR